MIFRAVPGSGCSPAFAASHSDSAVCTAVAYTRLAAAMPACSSVTSSTTTLPTVMWRTPFAVS